MSCQREKPVGGASFGQFFFPLRDIYYIEIVYTLLYEHCIYTVYILFIYRANKSSIYEDIDREKKCVYMCLDVRCNNIGYIAHTHEVLSSDIAVLVESVSLRGTFYFFSTVIYQLLFVISFSLFHFRPVFFNIAPSRLFLFFFLYTRCFDVH